MTSEYAANEALANSRRPQWMEPSRATRHRTNPAPSLLVRVLRRIYLWL